MADIERYRTLPQLFDNGLQIAGSQAPFLGHRPVESHEPLKFANHFVWQTWGEVDTRRRNVGSALQGLFNSGAAIGTNGLDTVGIWSANTPGTLTSTFIGDGPVISGNSVVPLIAVPPLVISLVNHPPPEWQIVDLATSLYGKTLVPLYENFGPDSIGSYHQQRVWQLN